MYGRIKKVRFLIPVLVFFGLEITAQVPTMPFELERYSSSFYSSQRNGSDPERLDKDDLMVEYLILYKAERASNPGNYFPNPGDHRSSIGQRIEKEYGDHPAIPLIGFLEDGCSEKSLGSILNAEAWDPLLPYQALAAFAMGETDREIRFLKRLDEKRFLSPVLKAWGLAAVSSAEGYASILTNGLQDLLAVRYTQLILGHSSETEVANRLVRECQKDDTDAMAFGDMWISPVVEPRVVQPFSNRLQVVGIGFALTLKEGENRLVSTAKGLRTPNAETPADRGLVSSYRYLLEGMKAIGEKKRVTELTNYIEKEGMQ